ncbi:related to trfA protein [Rhynchosporium agropyri]|uniref:Related to trfA protein n=1 Tax=Rhynchosporium agropyri TaxID=914238 RepID=A0A1E1L858_9HELO|nr:related to trfA protein [Rhynchosporium agropyri]
MTSISIPTSAAFHPTQLIPATHPAVFKTLYRLSRPSLLSLSLDWLDERNEGTSAVYLVSSSEDPDIQSSYSPAHSLSELREVYEDLQAKKGSKRDVVDRIIEGDWRNGISLYQLAMADMQYLYDHPASQKWTALKIVRLSPSTDKKPPSIPRFHPATFLQNLQREVLPDGKQKVLDSTKTFYVAFPDSSPYIYVSLAAPTIRGSTSDNKSLRKLMLEGIPKAFSKPRERYKLESTSLSARNLDALIEQRGGGRTNSAGGGWSVYVSGSKSTDTPLNIQRPTPETDQLVPQEESEDSTAQGMKRKHIFNASTQKRRKLLATSRFGNTGLLDDEKGIERLDIQIQDTFPSTVQVEDEDIWDPDPSLTSYQQKRGRRSTTNFEVGNEDEEVQAEGWRPDVRITFQGQHVFAGIRKLVEEGIVDGQMMPGWMTGEDGVSLGIVKEGRIKVFKGSGI